MGFVLDSKEYDEINIIVAYTLGLLLTTLNTTATLYRACYIVGSALAFDFFFTEPRFSLRMHDSSQGLSLLAMLVAAAVISILARRIHKQRTAGAQRAHAPSVLLATGQTLPRPQDSPDIMDETAR